MDPQLTIEIAKTATASTTTARSRHGYKRSLDEVQGMTPLPSPVLGSHPLSASGGGHGATGSSTRTSLFFGTRSPKTTAERHLSPPLEASTPKQADGAVVNGRTSHPLGEVEQELGKLHVRDKSLELKTPASPRLEITSVYDDQSSSSASALSPTRPGITREAFRRPDGVKVPTTQLLSPSQAPSKQGVDNTSRRMGKASTVGDRFQSSRDSYTVIKEIGQGAFSRVVLATRQGRRDKVALKLAERSCEGDLSDSLGGDGDEIHSGSQPRRAVERAQRQGRFFRGLDREMDILTSISHPNVISLLDTFETDLYRCFVLEYCLGGDLFDLVDSFDLVISHDVIRQMSKEMASALDYLHENAIVHRDLKLENILLNFPISELEQERGKRALCKITDFGLAKRIDPESPMQTTRCGSEEYAAPELLLSKMYDARQTDSWALGCVIYAMLVGELPFQRDLPRGLKPGGCEATFLARTTPTTTLNPDSPRSPGPGVGTPADESSATRTRSSSTASSKGRNGFFNRVVRGDYFWPLIELNDGREARGVDVDLDYPESARQVVGSLLQTRSSQRASPKSVLASVWLRDVPV